MNEQFQQSQPVNPHSISNTRPQEQLIDVAKENRSLLATMVANQEILIEQQKKKERWHKFQLWIGVVKYTILGGIVIWSFVQMYTLLQKFLGIFQGSLLGKASNVSNPLKDFNPADLESLLDNPALDSITQFFQ